MLRSSTITIILISFTWFLRAQENSSPYRLNIAADIPIILTSGALTAWGFHLINQKQKLDSSFVRTLDPNTINMIDRPATRQFSDQAEIISDYLFYSAFPYGSLVLLNGTAQEDVATIGLIYLEAVAITSAAYAMAAGMSDRYRPYTYNPNAPMSDRTSLHTRNSFFGGHPAIVATTTLFVAKVFSDYGSGPDIKYSLYGFAVLASLTTGYLRYKAGKHFPTDLAAGYLIAFASGYLVPELHKRSRKKSGFSMAPLIHHQHIGLTLTVNL